MEASQQHGVEEAAVLDIPDNAKTRIEFIKNERLRTIQRLAVQSKNTKALPDRTVEPTKSLSGRLDLLLRWLDEDLQMSPEIRQQTRIDQALGVMFANPQYHFPDDQIGKAKTLIEKWEAEGWGAGEVIEPVVDEEGGDGEGGRTEPSRPPHRQSSASRLDPTDEDGTSVTRLRLPPRNHPIFGEHGIMAGAAYPEGRRKVARLDPRYPKRSAKVYGNNSLPNGAWFPFRILALLHGAHGLSQAGISGNQEAGAYAIVVSGMYEDLDQDKGNVIFYSGSNSHDNEDPTAPPPSTQGTLALHASIATRNPVRVLRASSGKSAWAPRCGLRYDGLYRVESRREPINMKGGKYEQFKLVRLDGQPAIDISRPSAREMRDFERIANGY